MVGVNHLRSVGRWVRSVGRAARGTLAPGPVILLYHRVAELPTDPQWLAVSPGHFAEQMEVLRRVSRPIGLRDLAAAVTVGKAERRAAAVTFDDGYADNLHAAAALLRRYDVPATVFVVTGATGSDRELFWDELDRLLLQPADLPAELRVTVADREYAWPIDSAPVPRGWNVLSPDAPGSRQRAYRELCGLVKPLPDEARQEALGRVRAWAGKPGSGRPSHRTMAAAEVAELARGGLVDVGAHTVTHPMLARLPAERQAQELGQSKAHLEELVGRPVEAFAYPFGTSGDYTAETVALARSAGFLCACSNFFAPMRRPVDAYQLPRVLVRDWDGHTFARRLREWCDF